MFSLRLFMTNLQQRSVSGLGWNAATQILSKALQFAAAIILTRLLSSEEFGLIGMVLVSTGFALQALPTQGWALQSFKNTAA